jgi:hypothetical protein
VITVPDGATDAWEGHVNFRSDDELQRFRAGGRNDSPQDRRRPGAARNRKTGIAAGCES